MRTRILTIGAAIAALVAITGCTSGSGSTTAASAAPAAATAAPAPAGASAAPAAEASPSREAAQTATFSDVTEDSFPSMVLDSSVPTVVVFWAEWCVPCRKQMAQIAGVLDIYDGAAKFVKVNIDENPVLAERYKINGVPTLLMFNNGRVTASHSGVFKNENLMREWIERSR